MVCPGAKTGCRRVRSTKAHIAELNRRGLLDDVSMQGALDAPPPEYVAPTYAYLVSDRARDMTGRIFIAAGGFVGEFARPAPGFIGYRDHRRFAAVDLDELDALLSAR